MKPKPPKIGTSAYLVYQTDHPDALKYEICKDAKGNWYAVEWSNGILRRYSQHNTHNDAITWANERTRNARP